MDPKNLAYLKQDQIGKVIAQGLATLYTNKPQKPITYLSQWLINYSKNQKEITAILKTKQLCKENKKQFQLQQDSRKKLQQQKQKQKRIYEEKINQFKTMITEHKYHQELLYEQFPQFVAKMFPVAGCYLGELNHPKKAITDEDTDVNAHLNTSIPKLINYIGSSISHKQLMIGKQLHLDKGVTSGVFSLNNSTNPPAQTAEQGQEVIQQKIEKYIYIPNVVKNQKIHYFRLPKLGAYIAIPLIYNSFLKQSIFDTALKSRQNYIIDGIEFERQKKENLDDIKLDKEQLQKKIQQMIDKNNEQNQIDELKEQLQILIIKQKQKQEQKYKKQEIDLQSEKKQYVFCVDNLGSDKQFQQKDINQIVNLIEYFAKNWQKKQKQLLQQDIFNQINYLNKLEIPIEQFIQKIEKIKENNQQQKIQIDSLQNQIEQNYKNLSYELIKLKQHIKITPEYLNYFLFLKKFRIIKFSNLLQFILYFLGFKKSNINIQGQTGLNWKQVKEKYINQNIYEQILAYIPEGEKKQNFAEYAKIPKLIEDLDKFDESELFHYNIGLGILTMYIKKALKLRIANIELRKFQKQIQRKKRQQLLQENDKKIEQKSKALQKHKGSLSGEQVQIFNQQQWSIEYDNENPLTEIPAEIIDDIDNDI